MWRDLNPIVTYANVLACVPGYEFGPRVIYDYQFIYVVRGKGTARIQDRSYDVQAGDLYFYSPYVIHHFTADPNDPFELFGMHFSLQSELPDPYVISPKTLQVEESFYVKHSNQLIISGKDEFIVPEFSQFVSSEIKTIFDQIIKEYDRGTSMSPLLNRSYLIQFLVQLERWKNSLNQHLSREHDVIFQLKQNLEENAHLPYKRGWLRDYSQYHEDHAARLFRKHMGISPHEYHALHKMNYAKSLLAYTDLSITEITDKLNLGSIHYFSRRFKLHTGHTPSNYRKLRNMI